MTSSTHTSLHGRISLVAGGAIAAALLTGCSGMHGIRSASAAVPDAPAGKIDARTLKSVARAEAAVAKAPQDAALRTALGQAYLGAGRFNSAATAFTDVMTLGAGNGKVALGLALAQIGSGQPRRALGVLDQYREEIPAGDLGLALALAGETSRGVAILADAVRSGEASAKVRQNLAYAYALDGRWQEAKLMAAQDVPADQLDKRLALWALSMLPDRGADRIATLVGAPGGVRDAGQPEALALVAVPEAPQVAVEDKVAPVVEPTAAQAPAAVVAQAELPAAASLGAVVEANRAAQFVTPAPQPVAVHASVPARMSVAQAFSTPTVGAPAVAAATPVAERVRPLLTAAPRFTRTAAIPGVVSTTARPLVRGSHYIQLGAFSSYRNAKHAWGYYSHRNPSLAAYRLSISEANVKGKHVWRVAVGGISGRLAANTLCGRVKASGGACFAYSHPLRTLPAVGAAPVLQARAAVPAQPGATAGPVRARR